MIIPLAYICSCIFAFSTFFSLLFAALSEQTCNPPVEDWSKWHVPERTLWKRPKSKSIPHTCSIITANEHGWSSSVPHITSTFITTSFSLCTKNHNAPHACSDMPVYPPTFHTWQNPQAHLSLAVPAGDMETHSGVVSGSTLTQLAVDSVMRQ